MQDRNGSFRARVHVGRATPDGPTRLTKEEATADLDAAREGARLLAQSEGIFAGFSAGANLAAAAELLRGPEKGGCVAIVMCDSGLKYLSTDLWE